MPNTMPNIEATIDEPDEGPLSSLRMTCIFTSVFTSAKIRSRSSI